VVTHVGWDAVLIPNGVTVRRYAGERLLPGFPRPEATIGFLGRIDEPRKGLPVLVEALPAIAAAHPSVRLVVAGPGDVDEVAESLPPQVRERTEFLGLVSDEDKAALLRSVDVYVAPNTGGESFGIVLLEAMAAGATVLASDIDAFRTVLDGGRVGALFPVGDAAALSAAVSRLLGDPQERLALATAGRRHVQQYDWAEVARRVVAVYETVAKSGVVVTEDTRAHGFGLFARPRENGG
jgi:phosphatidylinositol alpha-mannosyltransferase